MAGGWKALAKRRIVKSVHELSGNLTRDTQAFLGRIGGGAFNVRLETRDGNIYLD